MPDTTADANQPPHDYAAITAEAIPERYEEVVAACDAILAEIARIPGGERTFANTMQPLDDVANLIGNGDGTFGFMAYVHPDEALRAVALEHEQKLETYSTGLGFREEIYRAVRSFAETAEAMALGPVEARFLERTLRDYRRNGFELAADQRARVQELKERLVRLGVQFRRNIDEYEDYLLLTRDQLRGLPDSYVERLQTSEVDGKTKYRVSLDYPEMYPFLEGAEDGELRRALFLKNHNKAVVENLPLLDEAMGIRDEIASILGYESWAAYVIEPKMAKTPSTAHDFLVDLERRVRVKADRDIEELRDSKRRHTGDAGAGLEIWDWRYYQKRVQQEQFEVDQFAVAEYFALDATLDGMFEVYQGLVNVQFVPIAETKAWHPDVRLYRVEDADDGHHIGHFYMDLHPRTGKYGHAAAFTLLPGRLGPDGVYQGGVSSIVANFTKPGPGSPSLLRHSEVETLFHEFGHILHQVMTRSPYVRFSGTSVERDFVEAPSQMLEHWTWRPDVLRSFARHVSTGEPLPEALLQRMIEAKNVGSGVHYLRQIYFARLDLAYHAAGREKDSDALAEELHPITGFEFPPETHFQAGFGHLFGYDAGYYGYLWSQVFGDDMYTRFEVDPAAGADYRRLVLEAGGTRDGDVMLREFLGREPRNEAFLREIGLDVEAAGG